MATMKNFIALLIVLFSISAFAGGGGGGGVLMSASVRNPAIVFHMGQENGLVKLAYGQLIDKKWQVQKLEIPEDVLMTDSSAMKALLDSKDLKYWAEIK